MEVGAVCGSKCKYLSWDPSRLEEMMLDKKADTFGFGINMQVSIKDGEYD